MTTDKASSTNWWSVLARARSGIGDRSARFQWGVWLGFFAVFWLTLRLLGRQFLSDSGLGLWTGARTEHTSQFAADPYTFTHVLHGIIFYWLLLPTHKRLSLYTRFFIASLVEAGWEIVENTPYVIDRYRDATAALGYYGDTILNATVDQITAMFGFWIAWKLDWKYVGGLVIAIEVLLAYTVRDNLTLNLLMLLYPFESIKSWQLGQ